MGELPFVFDPSKISRSLLPSGLPALEELKSLRQWVTWDYVIVDDRPTKVPFNPHSGGKASTSTPATWSGFDRAENRALDDGLAGIGFVFSKAGNIIGIDLDECITDDGMMAPWAREVVDLAETYAELSPSRKGIHLLCRGRLENDKAVVAKAANVEMYSWGRYFTVTGNHIAGTPTEIRAAPETLRRLIARVAASKAPAQTVATPPASDGGDFFRQVNDIALHNIERWVSSLFGSAARYHAGTGAWRVSSKSLGRDLQEDLSIAPNGIVDFGVHDMGDPRAGKRSPIDLVMEHSGKDDLQDAAHWLCERLGRTPESMGWNGHGEPSERATADAARSIEHLTRTSTPIDDSLPTPFAWPASLPRRQWLYGTHLIRRFLSCTVAPGGLGKSSMIIVEALAMASGRSLLGDKVHERANVWLWNGEDPRDELERRVVATCLHYHIDAGELRDRLFIDSGRNAEIVLASETRRDFKINQPDFARLEAAIKKQKIDVVVIDPFVAAHRISENDNAKIDQVCRELSRLAERTNCAIELVHHVRKQSAMTAGELTVDDARGAGALIGAVRSARILNRMTEEEKQVTKVDNRLNYFRVDNGKANLSPPVEYAAWRQLVSVGIGNGSGGLLDDQDRVGVVTLWEREDPTEEITDDDIRRIQDRVADGSWRDDQRSDKWLGKAVAEIMDWDLDAPGVRLEVKSAIGRWLKAGYFSIERRSDNQRKYRDFIGVGKRL